VRPSHLFVGTHADNVDDKVSKSRQGMGVLIVGSKLDDSKVRAIRAEWDAGGVTQYSLADRHGVHQAQISRIVHRKAWTHIA
jgi:hypothetical protein